MRMLSVGVIVALVVLTGTLQGVSYPVCTTNGNLNQRRVLSLSGENPASARLISNLDQHAAVGTQRYRGLKLTM